MVRLGVRELLAGEFEVEEAADWRGAQQAVTETGSFDVVVVELERARDGEDAVGGAALIRALRKAMPAAGIVAHARRPEGHAAREALAAGATAFVAKSSARERLAEAVRIAANGGDKYVDPAAEQTGRALTRRQRQILQLFADGHSTVEIAHQLGLSVETVRTHTKGLISRLGARDRAHAVALGMRLGLID